MNLKKYFYDAENKLLIFNGRRRSFLSGCEPFAPANSDNWVLISSEKNWHPFYDPETGQERINLTAEEWVQKNSGESEAIAIVDGYYGYE